MMRIINMNERGQAQTGTVCLAVFNSSCEDTGSTRHFRSVVGPSSWTCRGFWAATLSFLSQYHHRSRNGADAGTQRDRGLPNQGHHFPAQSRGTAAHCPSCILCGTQESYRLARESPVLVMEHSTERSIINENQVYARAKMQAESISWKTRI